MLPLFVSLCCDLCALQKVEFFLRLALSDVLGRYIVHGSDPPFPQRSEESSEEERDAKMMEVAATLDPISAMAAAAFAKPGPT